MGFFIFKSCVYDGNEYVEKYEFYENVVIEK